MLTAIALFMLSQNTWYVEADAGRDTNNCNVSTRPCATLGGAFSKIQALYPSEINRAQTINVAGGTYVESAQLNNAFLTANLTIAGPALTTYNPTDGGTGSGVLTGVSNTNPDVVFTDSTQSWADNELIGYFFTIVDGGTTPNRPIAKNTSTTVTLAGSIPSTPSVGSSYVIEKPAAKILATGTTALQMRLYGLSTSSIAINVSNIEFNGSTGVDITLGSQLMTCTRCLINGLFTGASYRGGGGLFLSNSSAIGGQYGYQLNLSPLGSGLSVGSPALTGSLVYHTGSTAAGAGLYMYGGNFVTVFGGSASTIQTNSNSALRGAIMIQGFLTRDTSNTAINTIRCLKAGPAGIMHYDSPGTVAGPALFGIDNVMIDGCTTGIDFNARLGNGYVDITQSLDCRGQTTCVSITNGAKVKLPTTFTTDAGTDILIDGTSYTKAQLTGASPTRLPTSASVTGSSVWQ